MNSLDQALSAFGEDIGMPGLALGARGNVALQLESGRRVAIEPSDEEVLVYVSDPAPYDAPERLLQAWRRAHYSRLDGWPVQAALREQDGVPRLLAATRLAAADASAHKLKQAVDYLSRWLDAARDD
ncbi:hypothetical protein WHX56_08380 [Achromobacter veterisilvae]|jgi:type III secretion system chaperone SycN|uniref:Type III secretion chaperone SycN n=1 Tax=Achromobacter veterisilvae TaxID=2069367 RepID=A0A446CPL3_9BURK|nr:MULTISPECIES: hypothetical protein [Achromobacter]MCW0211152.1 hypothetical protein [Achromobacter sp.]SSW69849.1 hypothetical protein AVE30378_03698 [Achromobacter veterisilvae]